MKFTIGEHEYEHDQFGIHQLNPKPFTYDAKYVSIYNTHEYKDKSERLQHLRCHFIFDNVLELNYNMLNLLDFGYGNGDFLRHLYKGLRDQPDISRLKLFGYDVSDTFPPIGTKKVTDLMGRYDIVTFWDSLEHVKDLSFLKDLNTKYVALSLPYCIYAAGSIDYVGIEWFKNWKHRKPNEHLHHFAKSNLVALFWFYGYEMVVMSEFENEVRKPTNGDNFNILSAIFKKI